MRFLRRALRRALARAGYRVARIPAQQIVPPGALAAQGIEAAGSHFPVLAAAVARTAGQGPVLELGMGYPRPMESPELVALRAKLWHDIREESLRAMGGDK